MRKSDEDHVIANKTFMTWNFSNIDLQQFAPGINISIFVKCKLSGEVEMPLNRVTRCIHCSSLSKQSLGRPAFDRYIFMIVYHLIVILRCSLLVFLNRQSRFPSLTEWHTYLTYILCWGAVKHQSINQSTSQAGGRVRVLSEKNDSDWNLDESYIGGSSVEWLEALNNVQWLTPGSEVVDDKTAVWRTTSCTALQGSLRVGMQCSRKQHVDGTEAHRQC